MEEEARAILRSALTQGPPPTTNLAARIRRRFAGFGDVALPIAPGEPVREPVLPIDVTIGRAKRTEECRCETAPRRSMSTLDDTNVLSELLRSQADAAALAWFTAQASESLFVTAATRAEMVPGAHLLPDRRRRQSLEKALAMMFEEDFADRILPFDGAAAPANVEVVSRRRAAGRPISQFDAQIAAIARHHGCVLATRNVHDFKGCGLPLVDLWTFDM